MEPTLRQSTLPSITRNRLQSRLRRIHTRFVPSRNTHTMLCACSSCSCAAHDLAKNLISGFIFACLAPLSCIPSSPTYFLSARIPSSVGLHRGGASDHTALPRRRLRVRHAARLRAPACPCLPRPQLPLPVVCYLQRPVGRAIRGHALDCAEFAESRLRPRTSRAARVCRLPDSAAAIWRFSARHVTRQRAQTARTLGLPRPALLNRRRRPAAGSPAGNQVEHAILPVRSRHISITFRRLRRPAPARERDGETPR